MQNCDYNVRSSQGSVIYSLIPKTKKGFIIFMSVISVLAFLVLYHYAGVASFWIDELIHIGAARSSVSFSDMMYFYKYQDTNAPLYFIFAFFWYRLVPHTEQALLILPILFVIAASIMTGFIGYKLSGIRLGILAFMFMIFSKSVLAFAAYEFRPYGLLLFLSAVNFYFYMQRLQDENWGNIIFYGITTALVVYTHYVSVLLYVGLFIYDCVLIAQKRISFRVITSYFIGALLFLPWFVLFMLPRMVQRFSYYFGQAPTIIKIIRFIGWCTKSSLFFYFPFTLIGTIYVIYHAKNNNFLCAGLFASAFMILISFIYCKFINPGGSFFVNRYFFSVMPFVCLITALGTDYIYTKIKPVLKDKNVLIFTAILFGLFTVNLFSIRHKNAGFFQPYREVADIIYQSEQSFNGKSAIITTEPTTEGTAFGRSELEERRNAVKGWEEVYLTRDHTREVPIIFTANEEELEQIKAGNYDRIYLCYIHIRLQPSQLVNWLKENYSFSEKIEGYNFQILERIK